MIAAKRSRLRVALLGAGALAGLAVPRGFSNVALPRRDLDDDAHLVQQLGLEYDPGRIEEYFAEHPTELASHFTAVAASVLGLLTFTAVSTLTAAVRATLKLSPSAEAAVSGRVEQGKPCKIKML
eukprot:s4237_g6.t1